MSIKKTLCDPSVLFILGCFSVPLILARDTAERIAFITDKTLWFSLSVLVATVYFTEKSKDPKAPALHKRDERIATWFLLNGAIIHIFMDGLMGVFKLCPPFQRHYAALDVRYATSDATVDVVSLVELFLMGPGSLALYYAIHTKKDWRHPFTILVSAFQLFGGILFVFTEVWWGGIHIPVDFNFEFTFHHILYFWFGFLAANMVWFIVPSYLIYDSSRQIVCAIKKAAQPQEAATVTSKTEEVTVVTKVVATKSSGRKSVNAPIQSGAVKTVADDSDDDSATYKTPQRASSRVRAR